MKITGTCWNGNFAGQKYDIGMGATPLNIDEFSENDILIVVQMIEAIIMSKSCIIKTGTIILRGYEMRFYLHILLANLVELFI